MYYRDKNGNKIDNKDVKENYTHKDNKTKIIIFCAVLVLSFFIINLILESTQLKNKINNGTLYYFIRIFLPII